ncbi:MAG: type 2 isopentenyl-diphosphate Delta-isomerase [Anaerolineaceae bacterium]|nr:type 2 isopentenyl-diphosphate Delta-isomerase [Anaerolineaceae bacterium]
MMSEIEKRKEEHLAISLNKDVRSGLTNGFERWSFKHQALPDLNLEEISTATTFLGKPLAMPLLISSMTGGTDMGDQINRILAEAANECGIAMAVGSQRAAVENPSHAKINLRTAAPSIPLYANLGAIQLNYGFGFKECRMAIDQIEADGLILHLNPLQEALQPEGQTKFKGLAKKIEQICRQIEVPVIVKEVGWGIDAVMAGKLLSLGVAAIDVAGAGGTSWSQVEKYRSRDDSGYRIAETFVDWGIPTADCVVDIRKENSEIPLIASGGITNGVEGAKAIALGANLFGIAQPFLVAAKNGTGAVVKSIHEIQRTLIIAMFSAGAPDLKALSMTTLIQRKP